jgi:hypothetical protein
MGRLLHTNVLELTTMVTTTRFIQTVVIQLLGIEWLHLYIIFIQNLAYLMAESWYYMAMILAAIIHLPRRISWRSPQSNSMVVFRSEVQHEVDKVSCKSGRFEYGRFTINGWISR